MSPALLLRSAKNGLEESAGLNIKISVFRALDTSLEAWRKLLPSQLRWKDGDLAQDINAARLRAKYYGAKYIIHRPLLWHALHVSDTLTTRESASRPSESPTIAASSGQFTQHASPSVEFHPASSTSRRPSGMLPPPKMGSAQERLDPALFAACKTCIQAAIHSTIAFDGVEGRLIVTNIFGTAHAYVVTVRQA